MPNDHMVQNGLVTLSRMLMGLLVLGSALGSAHGYAEGVSPLDFEPPPTESYLRWASTDSPSSRCASTLNVDGASIDAHSDTDPEARLWARLGEPQLARPPVDCRVVRSVPSSALGAPPERTRSMAATLRGRLVPPHPAAAPAQLIQTVCILVSVRSSEERAFWYLVPPGVNQDPTTRHCAPLGPDGTFALHLNLSLASGYHRISAHVSTANRSSTQHHPPSATLLVWAPRESDRAAAPRLLEESGCTVPNVELGRLRAAAAAAEADEAVDRRAKLQAMAVQAQRYAPHRLYRHLGLDEEGSSLAELLDPALLAALTDGSPAAIWGLLRGADHETDCRGDAASSSPCTAGVFTFPMFRPDVSRALIAEIEHAKASAVADLFSVPNNVGDAGARSQWTGVVLDEVGLGGLATALATKVLAPLAQAVHPAWAPWHIDSYHAFSIHVAPAPSTTTAGERQGADLEEMVVHRHSGDRLPSHIDVCEVSMNACLGNPGLNGSSVHFQVPGQSGETSVAHVPGRAFINVCQQRHRTDRMTAGVRHSLVVRGLASHLRRAPAELFLDNCVD